MTSDYTQLGIKAAVREVENESPALWGVSKQDTRSKPTSPQTEDTHALEISNQYPIFTGADTYTQQPLMPNKLYGSEQSQHVRQQHSYRCKATIHNYQHARL